MRQAAEEPRGRALKGRGERREGKNKKSELNQVLLEKEKKRELSNIKKIVSRKRDSGA